MQGSGFVVGSNLCLSRCLYYKIYYLLYAHTHLYSMNEHFMDVDLPNFCTLSFMNAISSSSSCLRSREDESVISRAFTLWTSHEVRKSFIRFSTQKQTLSTTNGHFQLSQSLSSFLPLLVREFLLPPPELCPFKVVLATHPSFLQTINLQY